MYRHTLSLPDAHPIFAAGRKVLEEVRAVAFAQRLEAAQVADRRVQPDVQELARVAGDLEAEVGRVARDVPGAQAAFAVQPLLQLGLDPGPGDRKSTRLNSSH